MPSPLCFRLPVDLHQAVEHAAANANMSISEWVRDMLYRVVYADPPGVQEGYLAGRALGLRLMNEQFRQAALALPESVEEAMTLALNGSPGRTGNQG